MTDPYFPGTVDPAWHTGDAHDWTDCSDPPEESCSDAGCPRHGWDPQDVTDLDGDGEPDGTVHIG